MPDENESDARVPLLGETSTLSLKQKCAYGVGHIHNDLCAAIWFSYSLVYFQLVAGAGPLLSGILVFIGQGVDAIATPLAGYLVDHTGCSRKTWHLIGTVLACVSFPMMFTMCSLCAQGEWSQGLYYAGFIAVFQCGWAIVQISHLSILPEMALSPKGRAELTAYRYTATMVSNVAVYLIALGFFHNVKGSAESLVGPSDSSTFQKIASSANIIGIAMSVVFQITAKRKWENFDTTENKPVDNTPLSDKLKKLCQSADIYKIAGVYTTSRLFLTITMEYIPLYINQVVLTSTEVLATVPLVLFISSAISSLFYEQFNNHLGHKITYLLGCISCMVGCILIYFITEKSDDPKNLYAAAATFGLGSAFTMVVSLSLAANLIGSQVECGAFVYSTVTFADKLINGVAVILIQYMKCANEAECPYFYRDVLAYLNGGAVLVGFVIFLTVPSQLFRTNAN